jgi:predicted metalloprotease with PDZ domain
MLTPLTRALAAPLLALGLMGAAQAPTELVLRPLLAEGKFTGMEVQVSFAGEADGETVLQLPDAWGGETELWRHLSDFTVSGAEMAPGPGEATRILRHAPGARVSVRYRIDGSAPARDRGGNDYRPLVRPDHFQLLGNTIVALPASAQMTAPAVFRLEGMPTGATFASDLEHRKPRGLTVLDLMESVLVGGDFRIVDAGGGVRLAIRGTWPRDDATWRAQLAHIGAGQRAYWGAREGPYLVTILPLFLPPESMSIGGTGRGDAFAFFATLNAQPERLDQTLAHEMMHTWISERIGGLDEENEAANYWLSEGFTDWAAFRTNVRGGLWTIEAFAKAFNESLEGYDLSAVRTAPNARILADFWMDEEVRKLPYRRGMLLATYWDYRLLQESGGRRDMDDVLRAMQRVAARRGDLPAQKIFPVEIHRLGLDIGADLQAYVQDGQVVPLPADLFAACGRIVSERRQLWERGFDFDATRRADWVITGVTEGSNAYAAGLRNGMQLRQWSERSDARDPAASVTAGVMDGGARREITWLPAANEEREVRRLVLDPAMDRAACAARLSGL